MGGFTSVKAYKARPKTKRAKQLKGARDRYTKITGRKPENVRKAKLYQDFSDLEKKQYAALLIEPESKLGKKTLLGG